MMSFPYDIPDIANVAILTDRTLSMVKATDYEMVAQERRLRRPTPVATLERMFLK
jgi:hypothetical protein